MRRTIGGQDARSLLRRRAASARNAILASGALDTASHLGLRWLTSATDQLDLLAILYCTDKSSRLHGYTQYYRQHLRSWRFRSFVLWEIGVGGHEDPRRGGSSLRLWRDYFPRAQVVGLDLHPKNLARLGPRVHVVRADQTRPADLLEVVNQAGPPSVVVDDGSHLGSDVRISLTTLFPLLAPGGWYVIEDLATSFLPEFGGDDGAGPATSLGVVDEVTRHAQAADPTFRHSHRDPPVAALADVAEVHTYPGICFIRKVS